MLILFSSLTQNESPAPNEIQPEPNFDTLAKNKLISTKLFDTLANNIGLTQTFWHTG